MNRKCIYLLLLVCGIGCHPTPQSTVVSEPQGSGPTVQNAPPQNAGERAPIAPTEGPNVVAQPNFGDDVENPVPSCGPHDSYRYIAEFVCPDGTNPLGGDPRRGAAARRGNVGANSTGHIIDLYEVPCQPTPVQIYVDMYQCSP